MRMSSITLSPSTRGHHDRSPRIFARVAGAKIRVPPLWSTHAVFAPQAAQLICNFGYCQALVTASACAGLSRAASTTPIQYP
jgi:hypothetical protein